MTSTDKQIWMVMFCTSAVQILVYIELLNIPDLISKTGKSMSTAVQTLATPPWPQE